MEWHQFRFVLLSLLFAVTLVTLVRAAIAPGPRPFLEEQRGEALPRSNPQTVQ